VNIIKEKKKQAENSKMEIFKRFKIEGSLLAFGNTGVVSDLHLGFSDYLSGKGILSYFDESKKLLELAAGCKKNKIKRLILNGDILHDFSKLNRRTEKKLSDFIENLEKNKIKAWFIEGNHDTLLRFFLEKRGLKAKRSISIKDVFITHGDKLLKVPEKARFIIIGHEHPAVKVEGKLFKAYLISRYKGINLIVMPSFFDFRQGTENTEEEWSPFHKEKARKRILIDKISSEYIAVPF